MPIDPTINVSLSYCVKNVCLNFVKISGCKRPAINKVHVGKETVDLRDIMKQNAAGRNVK